MVAWIPISSSTVVCTRHMSSGMGKHYLRLVIAEHETVTAICSAPTANDTQIKLNHKKPIDDISRRKSNLKRKEWEKGRIKRKTLCIAKLK